jgi:hypothetical protein
VAAEKAKDDADAKLKAATEKRPEQSQ